MNQQLVLLGGMAAQRRGWEAPVLLEPTQLGDQGALGPPIIVIVESELSPVAARSIAALAAVGRQVVVVAATTPAEDAAQWLPADVLVVASSGAVGGEMSEAPSAVSPREQALAALSAPARAMVTSSDLDARVTLAADTRNPKLLRALSTDDDDEVRRQVRGNFSCPDDVWTSYVMSVLDEMMIEESEQAFLILYDIASRPATPPEALERLARKRDDIIRYLIISNGTTSRETLSFLREDGSEACALGASLVLCGYPAEALSDAGWPEPTMENALRAVFRGTGDAEPPQRDVLTCLDHSLNLRSRPLFERLTGG